MNIEKAVDWILESETNTNAFKQDFSVIKKQFPNLSESELKSLQEMHKKGQNADSYNELFEVQGRDHARSHGW